MIDSPTILSPIASTPPLPGAVDLGVALAQLLASLSQRPPDVLPWHRALPWAMVARPGAIELHLTEMCEEQLGDPANRELLIACGAVIENARIAAGGAGYRLHVETLPPGDEAVVAHLRIEACMPPRLEDVALLREISTAAHRHEAMAEGALSPALTAVLRHAARSAGAWLDVIVDDARRELLADLEQEATIIADAERGARRLVTLRGLPPTIGSARFIAGGRPRLGELLSTLGGRIAVRHDWYSGRARRVRSAAVEAPLLAVLGTQWDGPQDWLMAGRAVQRVLLHAAVQGLRVTFLNEPLDHPLLRDALRAVLFADGAPHAIMRLDFDDDDNDDATRH